MAIPQALKNWRILTLLLFLIFALVAIRPAPFNDGVMIRSVSLNSAASSAGIEAPKANTAPLSHERIIEIDEVEINTVRDFHEATSDLLPNQTIRIVTNKDSYLLKVKPLFNETILNETELKTIEEFDNETNKTINKTIRVPKVHRELIGAEDIGIKAAPAAKSNLKKGLDLAGGSRVLLKPQEEVSSEDLESIIESLTQRLNIYGLSDVIVRDATDLAGSKFISVEIAGLTEEELRNLVASQGKFEAKIANSTVFIGGKKDIAYVCRTADCSGLNPNQPCQKTEDGNIACSFFFSITLSTDAAKRQADVTKNIPTSKDNPNYLSSPLELYLDDKLVDSLQISTGLKGRAETNIQISGSGIGKNNPEANTDALKEMKRLQTVLITGSLPIKLSIEKMDTVSPILGEKFMNNIMLVALLAFIVVTVVISIVYRNLKIALPMALTLLAEIILILGFAAVVGWNLDLAAMAGIIISIGTGVDHLIIIADETVKGQSIYDWKRKLKNAMFIIFGAYFTVLAGMFPLWFAGAGLLKGFAFTTIAGVSFGVLIARPAYAALLKILLKA